MSHRERVLELIRRRPGLSDREIREFTGIEPHQQVNQICNRLQRMGLTRRVRGSDGVLRNYPIEVPESAGPSPRPRDRRPTEEPQGLPPEHMPVWPAQGFDLDRTLVIVPCSSTKRSGGASLSGQTILDRLPAELAAELGAARDRNAPQARVEAQQRRLACDRYSGALYERLSDDVLRAWRDGGHVLIISGGYGVVLANEPIGWYDARLRLGSWPERLIPRCLAGYAQRAGVTAVVAFAPGSTDYAKAVRAARWPLNVRHARLVVPRVGRGGAMRRSPQAIGEAVTALWARKLHPNWRSPAGTPIEVQTLMS